MGSKIFRRILRYLCVKTDNTILEVQDLSIAFGERTVVERLNFTLERGKTLGIVGESGSGKSVSTLALMGLLPKNATVRGSAKLSPTPAFGHPSLQGGDEEHPLELLTRRASAISAASASA